ncbi:MAG: YbaB/EbfC family nucleoid-associated protein [Dehalococcoidia bacterium]
MAKGSGRNRYLRRGGTPKRGGAPGGMPPQLADAQAMLARAQQELAESTVEGTAGGGAVRITMTGDHKIVGVAIEPEVVDPDDVEMLQDLILAAASDAEERVAELQAKSFGAVTGGLNLPGIG